MCDLLGAWDKKVTVLNPMLANTVTPPSDLLAKILNLLERSRCAGWMVEPVPRLSFALTSARIKKQTRSKVLAE